MEQAVGRLVGALCVVTGKDDDAESAMLASWVSQVRAMPACSRQTYASPTVCGRLHVLDK